MTRYHITIHIASGHEILTSDTAGLVSGADCGTMPAAARGHCFSNPICQESGSHRSRQRRPMDRPGYLEHGSPEYPRGGLDPRRACGCLEPRLRANVTADAYHLR